MITFKLRHLLYERGMNIADLFRKTKQDVRYNTLLAYYHGYIKRINVKDLIKICDALECSLSDLIEYIPEKK